MTHLEMIEKIKAMPEEEKEDLVNRLDMWTLERIEANKTRKFAVGDIVVKDLEYPHDNSIQMDDVFLYHYILGLPLKYQLWSKKYPGKDQGQLGDSYVYAEIFAEGYTYNGEPFTLFSVTTKKVFDTIYKDIATEKTEE